ncbi:OmpA family protein [Rugamonas aquatica]|uniref:OmpA family protein n=1 Tax=Rugamonas aquatica TaxID=2743357 RepID=A0A6A7MXA3_9BURK|nr:OmpA family protein [Rugamonas aquatica]MQA37371.1 OmpA family protein [Rugamonas aquatica]
MKAAASQRRLLRLPPHLTAKLLCAAIGTTLASGCATDPRTGQPSFQQTFASKDPCSNNARNIGVAVGAIAGAILGNQVKHSNSARVVGALAGATIGGLIGRDMDQRRCELSKIARQYDLSLKTSTVSADGSVIDDQRLNAASNADAIKKDAVGMIVEVREQSGKGGHFETNSDQLTEQAQRYFSAIADSYNARLIANNITDPQEKSSYISQVSKRKILLVGHTDDTGSSRLNADLSERRAQAVAAYMEKRGIPKESLFFQGAGEAYPIADNGSEEGRAQNRRVEIVEIADTANFDRYLAERKPRYEFYRGSDAPSPQVAVAAPAAPPVVKPAPVKVTPGKTAPAIAGKAPEAAAANATTIPDGVDFGGTPLSTIAAADIGQLSSKSSGTFRLISNAYADEPPIMADCSRDRPRVAHGVKALQDGKSYRTSEYLPGLYGKTWTEQVNGHQVVLNKLTVLASNGAAANLPEFKVYTNYNPVKNANPAAALALNPEVNTYLGNKGLLYRMFFNGKGGLSCADVVFGSDGGTSAKGGRLIYARGARLMSADFKPTLYQK